MGVLVASLSLCLCVFSASAFEPLDDSFSSDQLKGTWWVLGLASNSSPYTKLIDSWVSIRYIINVQEDGAIYINYKAKYDRCVEWRDVAEETDTAGKFTASARSFDTTLTFLSVEEDEYALLKDEREWSGSERNVMYLLLARTKSRSPELEQKLKDFTSNLGIPEEFTVFVSAEDDPCFAN